jgi:hypothetical protein
MPAKFAQIAEQGKQSEDASAREPERALFVEGGACPFHDPMMVFGGGACPPRIGSHR